MTAPTADAGSFRDPMSRVFLSEDRVLRALSADAARNPTSRDRHITEIRSQGRMAWQQSTGYNRRSRGEAQIGRWKAVIGGKLRARKFENQKTEAGIGAKILNRMTGLGRPHFERIA